MTVSYNPSCVTNGLVLYLDAGNTKSYPGSGTTWVDTSGNSNNFTFVGSPTYSSANGGLLALSGSGQYINGPNSTSLQLTGDLTISAWVSLGDLTNQGIAGKIRNGPYQGYGITKQSGYFKFWTAAADAYTYTQSDVTYIATTGWYNVVGVRTSGTNRLWINGVLQNDSQSPAFADSGDIFTIGRYYSNNTSYNAGGNISAVSVYNRALSSSEILQNYNALRGRYGV